MLKITHLEGYAGLRLKNNQPIEIKKGINLAIGKNGSGKSNLATLAKFIFNESQQPNKKLIESTFIDDLVTKTIAKYRERKTASEQNNRAVNSNIQRVDFEHKLVCKFLFEEVAGSISFKLNQEISLETFADFMKRMNFSSQYIFIEPVQRLLTIDILAQIGLNNEEILINKDIRLFQASGQNSQNPIVSSIVTSFNTFFERRWQQFNENDTQLQSEFSRLKDEILFQYSNFFVQVNKEIHITLDPTEYEGKALVLKENGNIITFESLSDGEKNLFNLIINISLARTNKPAFIHLDEPELFMHDDMIKTLVKEIRTLSSELPDTCVFISTHSSVLIELLAELGEDELNLITIVDKMVSNSKNDIEFINVLNNNGVVFSPLYISKKPNLFIENNSEDGRNHREFYSGFFNKETKPNIIPIGSSGQVKTYKSFKGIIEDIFKSQHGTATCGILDGDIYLIKRLSEYIDDKIKLADLTAELATLGQFYIFPQNFEMGKLCYFNFWEIENLYLLPDVLGFWKKKDDNESLTLPVYILFLIKNKDVTIQSWLKTIRRMLVSPIYNNDDDLEKYKKNCETNIQRLSDFDQKKLDTNKKMENFFEAVIDQNLLQWIPGKEVYKALKNAYNFNLGDVDLSTLSVANSVRKIIE